MTSYEDQIKMEDNKNTKTLLSILQKKKYACKYCEKSYTESYSRKRHMTKRHHNMMSTAENTESEIQSHCTKKEYICDNCDLIYDDDDSFESHMLGVHNFQKNEITYDCSNCYESFSEKVDYEKHLIKKTKIADLPPPQISKEKLLICDYCQKSFKRRKYLRIHQKNKRCLRKTLPKEKLLICDYCQKSFTYERCLKIHLEKNKKCLRKQIIKEKLKLLICEYCQKSFTFEKYLKNHLQKDKKCLKKQLRREKQKLQQKIKCLTCEESFGNYHQHKIHRDLVHQKLNELLCQFCGNEFRSRTMIKRHINLVHKNLKNYKCETCGEGFILRKTLDKHFKIAHAINQDDKCEFCGKEFETKEYLEVHMDFFHNEKQKKMMKNFQCECCDTSFIYTFNLNKHIKSVHEKIKTLDNRNKNVKSGLHEEKQKSNICKFCAEAFENKEYLSVHIDFIHNEEEQNNISKNFQCSSCDKSFAYTFNLNKHLNLIHK